MKETMKVRDTISGSSSVRYKARTGCVQIIFVIRSTVLTEPKIHFLKTKCKKNVFFKPIKE